MICVSPRVLVLIVLALLAMHLHGQAVGTERKAAAGASSSSERREPEARRRPTGSLTRVRPDKDGFRSPWIEGYCSKQSVQAGETIDIMVSTDPPRRFSIEIFRMGYYGGRGAAS